MRAIVKRLQREPLALFYGEKITGRMIRSRPVRRDARQRRRFARLVRTGILSPWSITVRG